MKILAIDTSCDETSAAITEHKIIHSNIVWSQSSLHSSFGGVLPSLAQRQHQERIDFVVQKALKNAFPRHTIYGILHTKIDAIAVTVGPGLAVALAVGVNYAKDLALKYKKPLIPVNHIEAHLLSPFAQPKNKMLKMQMPNFPTLGLVLSGGTTILCLIKNIGEYEILANTADDALGEALDKAARLLGLGYPGGAILEKFAKLGDPNKYKLPVPLIGDVVKNRFSYSGLKTAFVRLFESIKNPTKQDIYDLAARFQNSAFKHIERVLEYQISHKPYVISHMLFGGGVAANVELRKRLRKICKNNNIIMHTPYSLKLCGDNAGMIGVTAYLNNKMLNAKKLKAKYGGKKFIESVDINPKLKL